MNKEITEKEVFQHTQGLFRQAVLRDAQALGKAKLARPLPVYTPQGKIQSWFVAVTVEDRIAGFFQLSPTLILLRYASFQRRPGSTAGCPPSDTWLSPKQIMAQAAKLLQPGETMEPPLLTYDKNPDRLAWAVNVRAPDGATRVIFVAGEYAYQKANDVSDSGPET